MIETGFTTDDRQVAVDDLPLPSSRTQGRVRLTVVLPAMNEGRAVGRVLEEVCDALREWPEGLELIVVDDGSRDATAQIASDHGAHVIRRPERGGYGAAVKCGIRAARGLWVALIDADGSYDPASLPTLLEHLPAYDQVNGARQRELGRWPLARSVAKIAIRKLAEWISGKRIPDLNTGMKVFKRDLAIDCLWALPDGFSASSSLTLAFLCDGRLVKYVPVPYRERAGGFEVSSHHGHGAVHRDRAQDHSLLSPSPRFYAFDWPDFLACSSLGCLAYGCVADWTARRRRDAFRLRNADCRLRPSGGIDHRPAAG